ncbi:hypothetical protein DRE_05082 [Drechslerella stenobrocha 248]|uniref:RCHY1 zinc-ribbon domain-containing protein n=1 Tax=Drechslerella stenobrocha 248 TaxID=1043628 RepID=W7I9M8_9PEZI|nr:hypothetical protein DRE_05082 [Drechslerella stenobrocha 248]
MESRFRYLDYEIQRQPLPDPYKYWHCHIICNDCSAKSDVTFHFLGLKCDTCKSYNTCEVKVIRPEDELGNSSPASVLSRGPLPPHLMPNPETAGTIVPGEEVVADLASVIQEIEDREGRPGLPSAGLAHSSQHSECSCESLGGEDGEGGGSLYDSDDFGSEGGYDDDGDDNGAGDGADGDETGDEDEPMDDGPARPEFVHLPGHP